MVLRGHSGRRAKFSPDGKYIVLGTTEGKIQVWNALTGVEVATFPGHSGRVSSIACSPDGKRIVSGSSTDPIVKVWNIVSGTEVLTLPSDGPVLSVAFSPDGKRIISSSMAGTVTVWDAATGDEVMNLVVGLEADVSSVAFSPDGKTIAAGTFDHGIRLWGSGPRTSAGGSD